MNTILFTKFFALALGVPSLLALFLDLKVFEKYGLPALIIAALLVMMHSILKMFHSSNQKNQDETFKILNKISDSINALTASQIEHNLTSVSNFNKITKGVKDVEEKVKEVVLRVDSIEKKLTEQTK